jgi:hypothetical protein
VRRWSKTVSPPTARWPRAKEAAMRLRPVLVIGSCFWAIANGAVFAQKKIREKAPPTLKQPLIDGRAGQALIDDTDASGLQPESGEAIVLFNGRNFNGWTYVLSDAKAKLEDVWSVREGGVLNCKGRPTGHLRTKQDDFENYELTLEWRWPTGKGGNSGVLVHTTEPRVLGIWPRSHEVQLYAGNAGDIWVIGTTIEIPNPEGRIKERRHFNLTDNSEKPPGEWNKLRVICNGDELTIYVNGDKVNYARKLSQSKGAICLQSEGAEVEFRKIELVPMAKRE